MLSRRKHTMAETAYHIPVLLKESIDALEIKGDGIYVDATLGGGGHSREILSRLGPDGRLIVFDRDSDAIRNAPEDSRVTPIHHNFRFIHHFIHHLGYQGVDGIIADLGVSSHQFDTSERGFSFRFEDAGLDMRMNTMSSLTAEEILNSWDEERIADTLYIYGEVENSRRVASLICKARKNTPITTSRELIEAIKSILPPVGEHKVLARIYQALRIEVNGEMSSLEHFLKGAAKSLKRGGRMSIITYHSLEDRMVKNFIRSGNVDGRDDSMSMSIYGLRDSLLKAVNRKPIVPDEEEITGNTRARSAKLRICERL